MYSFLCVLSVTMSLVCLSSGLASSVPPMDFANIPWPKECGNKTYCHKKPDNYPQRIFDDLLSGLVMKIDVKPEGIQDRTSVINDIGNCDTRFSDEHIYLIKDENDKVRVVAETEYFKQIFFIKECKEPGKITYHQTLAVKSNLFCYETTMPILLNVLSLDGSSLDSAAPKGGLPFSCSTKKMRKVYRYN